MRDAFNAAWAALTADPDYKDGTAEWAREVLALRIIETAQAGEHDVIRLRDDALAHLAEAKMEKKSGQDSPAL